MVLFFVNILLSLKYIHSIYYQKIKTSFIFKCLITENLLFFFKAVYIDSTIQYFCLNTLLHESSIILQNYTKYKTQTHVYLTWSYFQCTSWLIQEETHGTETYLKNKVIFIIHNTTIQLILSDYQLGTVSKL